MPRSYKKLWHQKIAFTGTGDRKIPLVDVVYLEDVIVFLASIPVAWVLVTFTPIAILRSFAPEWAAIPILSFGGVYATRKLDPAGKSLPRYLWSAVAYGFRGHLYRGAERLPRRYKKRAGQVHRDTLKASVSWTKGDLPVPVEIQGERFDLTLGQRVDITFHQNGVHIQASQRLRLPSKRRWYAVKAGRYRYENGNLTPRR